MGWYLAIYQQTPLERQASHDHMALLASWDTGVSGLAWLDKPVIEGKAEQLLRDGYPSRYMCLAADVLPLIASFPPTHYGLRDCVRPPGWIAHLKVDQPKLDACLDGQILTIDAWDQS
jgi:hypothetical protein